MAQSVLDPVRGKSGRTQPATVVPLVAPHRRRPAWMIWGAALVIVAAVVAVTSLVLVITRVARTSEQAQGANAMIGILMGVLGGSFFPITGSGLLGRISDLTPTAAFIRGLGITSGGGQVADLGGPLAVFAAFGVGALAISMALGDDTALT